jgi:polyisoprenoid-binding protein YceI
MPVFDARRALLVVHTFREGLLSAAGHDLALRAESFLLALDPDANGYAVRLSVDASSLRVLHALRAGEPLPSALSDRDRTGIEASLRAEVLHTSRYPEISFTGRAAPSGESWSLDGELALHGTKRRLQAAASPTDGGWLVEVELDQRAFGITPYRAMLGALRVKPEVRVRLALPAFTP